MVKKLDVVHFVEYRPPTLKPCSDCPFRRKAMAGWLGAGSPESFIDCINRDDILPCHQTIDYTDPAWKEKWVAQTSGNACAGALIMTANMCKRPRDPTFPKMESDEATVFSSSTEFIAFHRSSPIQSWDDAEQSDESKYLRSVFEKLAARCDHPEHRRGTRGGLRPNQQVCMQCGALVTISKPKRKKKR